jgi:hypothetical protein
MPLDGGATVQYFSGGFCPSLPSTVVLVHGPLTLQLHCSELIANVIRDVLAEGWTHNDDKPSEFTLY